MGNLPSVKRQATLARVRRAEGAEALLRPATRGKTLVMQYATYDSDYEAIFSVF